MTSPANRIGTFLGATSKETAHIVVGGADYYCNVDPRIPLSRLKKGHAFWSTKRSSLSAIWDSRPPAR